MSMRKRKKKGGGASPGSELKMFWMVFQKEQGRGLRKGTV